MADPTLSSVLQYGEPTFFGSLGANRAKNAPWTQSGDYRTNLAPLDEAKFQRWVRANNVPFDPHQTIQDYDMRGFYSALKSGNPVARSAIDPTDSRLHYPDVWKTPYHESFSNESQWATPDAPYWVDGKLIPRTPR